MILEENFLRNFVWLILDNIRVVFFYSSLRAKKATIFPKLAYKIKMSDFLNKFYVAAISAANY